MNDKVNEQLADLLAFVKAGAEKTTDFAVEQAPLVAREIVAWQFWSALVTVVMAAALLVAIWTFSLRIWRKATEEDKSDSDSVVMYWIVVLTVSLVLVIPMLLNFPTVIKSIVAPRLVVIDYIGRLAK